MRPLLPPLKALAGGPTSSMNSVTFCGANAPAPPSAPHAASGSKGKR